MAPGSWRTAARSDSPLPTGSALRPRRLLALAALVTGAAIALTGCFGGGGGGNGADGGTGDFVDDGCTHIVVATSSEKVNMLDA
ncbi:MAG: hypothetical protein ABW091_13910, partial [Microbacterium sp.]